MSRKIAAEILSRVAPEVADSQAALDGHDLSTALTLTFSAKEALFKALHPHVGTFLGFEAARLTAISRSNVTVELELVSDLSQRLRAGQTFTLPYLIGDGLVVTALALSPGDI